MSVTVRELRERIAFLERNYERSELASAEDIAAIAHRFKGRKSKDSLWEHWAELRALGLGRASRLKQNTAVSSNQLETAAAALAEKPEEVELPSLGIKVKVHPASYARIERIEEHAFWMNMLEGARSLLLAKRTEGNLRDEELDGQLKRARAELSIQRAWLYTQVTAPSAAPVDDEDAVVDWANHVTPVEDVLLMQAYHRVNQDVISGLPQPRSADGKRELPRSWAFLFASMSVREKRPAAHIMRDRSLASIVATYVLEELREQERKKKSKSRKSRGA